MPRSVSSRSRQLLVGDALLPRAVVLGSAAILVPWYVLCWAFHGDADARAEDRDRVVAVCSADDRADRSRTSCSGRPERPAMLVGWLSPHEARADDPPVRAAHRSGCGDAGEISSCCVATRKRTTTSCAQSAELHCRHDAFVHCRSSTSSGSASFRCPSSSASRCCSTSARCTHPPTAGSSASSTSCWPRAAR